MATHSTCTQYNLSREGGRERVRESEPVGILYTQATGPLELIADIRGSHNLIMPCNKYHFVMLSFETRRAPRFDEKKLKEYGNRPYVTAARDGTPGSLIHLYTPHCCQVLHTDTHTKKQHQCVY